jgi:hypothetical protein
MSIPLNVPKAIAFSASKEAAPRQPNRKKSILFDDEFDSPQSGSIKMSVSSIPCVSRTMNRRESNESTITSSFGDFDCYSQLSIDPPTGSDTVLAETDARHNSFAPDNCSFRMPSRYDASCSTFAQGYSVGKINLEPKYNDHDKKGLSVYRSELPLQEEPNGVSVSTFCTDYSSSDIVFGPTQDRRGLLPALGAVGGSSRLCRDQQSFLEEDPLK